MFRDIFLFSFNSFPSFILLFISLLLSLILSGKAIPLLEFVELILSNPFEFSFFCSILNKLFGFSSLIFK
jgi:hypothetical protein